MTEQELTFMSDDELHELGYTKQGRIWTIAGQKYMCKEATKDGYYFVIIK